MKVIHNKILYSGVMGHEVTNLYMDVESSPLFLLMKEMNNLRSGKMPLKVEIAWLEDELKPLTKDGGQ